MEDQKIIETLTKLEKKVTSVHELILKLCETKRYMSIPEAAKYYSMSENRLRQLCKDDVIEGCYSAMNTNVKKKHYTIDTQKLDELIDKGGMIAFVVNKYMTR